METRLYEDNAGSLTITHGDTVYRGFEHLTDGTTFVAVSGILSNDIDGNLDRYISFEGPVDEDVDDLIATCEVGVVEIVGSPGIAASDLLGDDNV